MKKLIFFSVLIMSIPMVRSLAQDHAATYEEWTAKANTFAMAKQYPQAAEAFSKAFAANGGGGAVYDRYNAACVWAMSGNKDSSFFQLNKLTATPKFTDVHQLQTDADLNSLHNDKRWQPVIDKVKQNKLKAEARYDKPLVAKLEKIYQDDQDLRQKLTQMQEKYSNTSPEIRKILKEMGHKDSVNVGKVQAILDKYGWLGADIVGEKGNSTLFLVIQHADLKVQEQYLPMMRQAVKNNNANAAELAMLEDRINVDNNRKQVYGSQISTDAQGNYLAPLEDPDNVDKRRDEVGLGPIAEYLHYFKLEWNVNEYKKQLPDIEKRQARMYN